MVEATDDSEHASHASLENALTPEIDVDRLRDAFPAAFAAASEFWRVPNEGASLTPRLKELVLVGIHAAATTLNAPAVQRHVHRALAAGATPAEVVDVLITIVGMANHALYVSMPILDEELKAAGVIDAPSLKADAEYEAAKEAFIRARGFWNTDRDLLARLIPDYYRALDVISTTSWNEGPLSAKERAFICIGIDSTITHTYEPGLRRHIRNALKHGAAPGEMLDVLKLSGMIGLESYILGAHAMFGIEPRNSIWAP